MAIKLRAHSSLLLTARNKSATSATRQDSWSGEHPQTVLLPLSDVEKLRQNFALADQFMRDAGRWQAVGGGLLARDVSPDLIAAFLRNYACHDDAVVFRGELLADWIMERCAVGELTDWSLFVASPAAGRPVSLGGRELGLVRRRRLGADSIGILVDPAHEGVDLPGGPSGYRRPSGEYDAEAMRAARTATQGLLILYPLDPDYMATAGVPAVIALSLSLPQTSDAAARWVVNSMVANG